MKGADGQDGQDATGSQYQIGDTYTDGANVTGTIVFLYRKNGVLKGLVVGDLSEENYSTWTLPTFEQMSILFNNRYMWNSDNTKAYKISEVVRINFNTGVYQASEGTATIKVFEF